MKWFKSEKSSEVSSKIFLDSYSRTQLGRYLKGIPESPLSIVFGSTTKTGQTLISLTIVYFFQINTESSIGGLNVFIRTDKKSSIRINAPIPSPCFFLECSLYKPKIEKFLLSISLWEKIPTLIPQAVILGIPESSSNYSIFKNNKVFIHHILLIFKLYVFKSREKKFINLNNLIAEIRKVKTIEKEIALTNSMKTIAFTKKWLIINNIIP